MTSSHTAQTAVYALSGLRVADSALQYCEGNGRLLTLAVGMETAGDRSKAELMAMIKSQEFRTYAVPSHHRTLAGLIANTSNPGIALEAQKLKSSIESLAKITDECAGPVDMMAPLKKLR